MTEEQLNRAIDIRKEVSKLEEKKTKCETVILLADLRAKIKRDHDCDSIILTHITPITIIKR